MSQQNSGENQPSNPSTPPGQWPSGQWGSSAPDRGQQSSGPQPHGQPSAPSADWGTGDWQQQWQQQPATAGPNPPYGAPPGGQSGYGPPGPPPHRSVSDANPFRAAFDFTFDSYATPGLVKIIYVLAVILAAIWWIGGTIMSFITGAAITSLGDPYGESGGAGGVVLGIFWLLLGWIPALLWLLLVRIMLEASIALVRVADDIRHLRQSAG